MYPLINNSLAPNVIANHPAPASGTDAFNQDDQGRLHPTLPVTDLPGGGFLVGSAPFGGGFGTFGSF